MDRLWAPWRQTYISTAVSTTDSECFICRGLGEQRDRENHIVHRGTLAAVLLNRYPYNNGHLMVAPLAHQGTLDNCSSEELLDLQLTLRRCISVLTKQMKPDGFNVGLNLGRVAGAGLPGHLHWHIVPRWNGDTNFMPVLSDTKVISQSLDALYEMLVGKL